MGLDSRKKLNQAIAIIEKCNKLIEEIRVIDNRRKALQEQLIDSALSEKSGGETTSKELIGLGKVLESMQEQLNKNIEGLKEKMAELKSVYRAKAEAAGIGKIAEAVPE